MTSSPGHLTADTDAVDPGAGAAGGRRSPQPAVPGTLLATEPPSVRAARARRALRAQQAGVTRWLRQLSSGTPR